MVSKFLSVYTLNQNLYGIVQGGLNAKLREKNLFEMIKRDLPGYAIGGVILPRIAQFRLNALFSNVHA